MNGPCKDNSTDLSVRPYRQFERVLQAATPTFDISDTPPISILTSENRDRWATAREHLMNYHEENARNLEAIERSLFCVSLREANPQNLEEVSLLV